MIDLRKKGLPNTIEVAGNLFSIKTDFREWIKFAELNKKDDLRLKELFYLFKNDIPQYNFYPQLMEFFINANATPRSDGTDSERVVDYVLDGEYIYSSFMQVYGIDLTECEMHWHKFKALFISLPRDCKMSQIMEARSYKKDSRKMEKQLEERKNAWALPYEAQQVPEEIIEAIAADFYNA